MPTASFAQSCLQNPNAVPNCYRLPAAVAVAETIGKVNSSQAKIKWPNDILLDGKKVAGILLESKKSKAGTIFIIGIGINCHQTKDDFPADLQKTATSIDIESPHKMRPHFAGEKIAHLLRPVA